MSKLLTVFGATGQQGGSLLHYLLKRPDALEVYRFRGVTRDMNKPAAVVLKDAGVEMVQADMDDESSLKNALVGSSAVFAMTDCYADWDKASAEVEVARGKAIADAAVAVEAELIIWSSLPNVTAMTNGKITVWENFDSKATVETYIRELPIKSAFFMPAMYMQMMKHVLTPQLNEEGELIFSVVWSKDTPCPLIDITDTGKFLVPILLNPDKYNKTSFTAATAFYTPAEMMESWRKVTGKEMKFVQAVSASSQALPPKAAEMLKEGVGLIEDFKYYGFTAEKDLEWTLAQLDDPLTSWEDFVKANEPWF
ncbi:MAG: hypothetical protein Q9201_007262 [Fulgogasparrea decipioides]